jgi:hypothetical protein
MTRNLDALMTSESTQWLTPKPFVDRVERALGGQIDLDPCSNSHLTPNVRALDHFTVDDDGLAQEWHGAVYMNPPYGDEIAAWTTKLAGEYHAGRVTKAIALLPARTDTRWWHQSAPNLICYIEGRLRFSGSKNSAPFPSAVWFFGDQRSAADFVEEFCPLGRIDRHYL